MANASDTTPKQGTAAPTAAASTGTGSKPIHVIFRLLRERKGLFAANLGLRLFKDLLPFANPILVGIAIDLLSGTDKSLFGYQFKSGDLRAIYIVAGLMATLAVAKMVFGYIHTIVAAHMGRHVVEAARRDLAEASMHMALAERRRFNSGDLLDRSLADTKGLRSFTQDVIIRIVSNTVRAVLPLIFMFSLDWVMAIVVLAVIPLQSGISAILQRRLQRLTRVARAAESEHTSNVKESIDGWSSVASVGGQDWVTGELRQTAARSETAKIKKKHTTAAISAVISLCTALGIAACYAIGGWRIISTGLVGVSGSDVTGFSVGDLVAFVGIAKKVYAPFQAYTKIVSSYRTGLVNLERIAEVLDAPKIDPRRNGPELTVTTGDLQLSQVGFTYDQADKPTLNSLSGTIPGRTLTVITGSSGAGKTTLLRLLLGIDQPHQGSISIDGQDINIARLASVQRVMSLVPQEPMLFTGTLGDNLMLGHDDATTEDLLDVCHKAGLLDLVRELPEGLDTEVGSGKHMLSGGQLRRMAIARALLRKPAILLLDEPTAGLDDLSSKQVLDTLRRIAQSATVIMVSHRRDPLAASDHHLILEAGSWSDGTGNGDRWRPESTGTLTEQPDDIAVNGAPTDGATANGATTNGVMADALASRDVIEAPVDTGFTPETNGHHDPTAPAANAEANGHATHPNGSAAEPSASPNRHDGESDPANPGASSVTMGHRVLQLSAMGRPISLNYVDDDTATARVLIVGGHRSNAGVDADLVDRILTRAASDSQTHVAVAAIADLNPDGAFSSERRTVLGVDLANDHLQRLAGETNVFHDAIEDWESHLIIDVGERTSAQRATADIEVAIRFAPTADENAPEWLAHLGSDIRRRLTTSRFSVAVSLVAAESSSVAAVTGVPVVEVTAVSAPHMAGSERSAEALVEAATAAYQSTGLLRMTTSV